MASRYGATETALSRHETWRKGFNRMLIAVIGMVICTMLAVMMAFWAASTKPEPRYFAAREDGGILPIVAVKEPFLTNNQVTNFATEAITRAMTINFANWRQDLVDASAYFKRPEGWDAFVKSINDSGMMNYIVTKRLIATAVANGAVIVETGTTPEGVYYWAVQVPMTITYQSSAEQVTENILADMQIIRVPTWEMSRGVAVNRVTMRKNAGGSK